MTVTVTVTIDRQWPRGRKRVRSRNGTSGDTGTPRGKVKGPPTHVYGSSKGGLMDTSTGEDAGCADACVDAGVRG